jgi:hypothetical protein
MSSLGPVRHTVRRAAARARRQLMWTPGRFRWALAAVLALLVLVPVASLLARAPWSQAASRSAAATTGRAGAGIGVTNGLDGPGPSATGSPGPTTSAGTPSTGEPAVDASALPVASGLAGGTAATTSGPSRRPEAAASGPTLSPGAATDRWRAQARTSAVRFAQAWLAGATAASTPAWLRTLDPWLDPDARAVVELTNRSAIPRTAAVSVRLLSIDEADGSAVVALADGGRLDIELSWDGESWRVASYAPVEAAAVSAPPVASPPSAGTSGATSTGTPAGP